MVLKGVDRPNTDMHTMLGIKQQQAILKAKFIYLFPNRYSDAQTVRAPDKIITIV